MALGACADGSDVPVDSRDADFLLVGKGDGPGIDEDSDAACSVLAAANGATSEDLDEAADIDARAVRGIISTRPFGTLAALDKVPYVGPVAFERLLAFAAEAGFSCGAPAPTTCSAKGGSYEGVSFTAAAECRAVAFLNGARFSDMRALPDTARRAAYDHCANGASCLGYRFNGWTSVDEFAAWPKIGGAAVRALATAAASWSAGELGYDTVADVWTRRSALNGSPITMEKVFVTRGGIAETGSFPYTCFEVRDAPDAPNYIHACLEYINADSAPGCTGNPKACMDPWVGKWVWLRGTVRKTTAHAGGYKINLIAAGPHVANPALLGAGEPVMSDAAWQEAARAEATRLVGDYAPLDALVVAPGSMPAAAQARMSATSAADGVDKASSYRTTLHGRDLYLVVATDGSGEGNTVQVDLIDGAGEWFAHGIGHAFWDGGGSFSWDLNDDDTTICVCGSAGDHPLCTWLDGSEVVSTSIVCE